MALWALLWLLVALKDVAYEKEYYFLVTGGLEDPMDGWLWKMV